jgi:hypothetical protein
MCMPQDDDSNSDDMSESHPTLWVAHLTKVDEHQVRTECFIPKNIKICFDEEGKGAVVRSDSHEVYLYNGMFRDGF